MMNRCLEEAELRRFHAGELNSADAAQVRAHFDKCPACKQRDVDLIAEHEGFVRQLRGLSLSERPLAAQAKEGSTQLATLTHASPVAPVAGVGIEGFEILREIHRGGQGVVYEAFQASMKRKVAIKVLLGGAFSSAAARKRFEREIELVASLKHPNIIAVHDSGVTGDNQPYYVMEYIKGERLDHYVRATQRTLEEVLKLFKKI